jgi:transposase
MSAAPTATAFVGIDVAQDKLDVMLCQGQQSTYRVFANTADGFDALHAWLCPLGLAHLHVCLEATGSYSDGVAYFLAEQGYALSLLNPAVLVNYRKTKQIRRKTDRQDAYLLALYAQENRPRLWQPLPAPLVQLRYLLAYRRDVLGQLGQTCNRLHAGRLTRWTAEQLLLESVRLLRALTQADQQIQAHLRAHADLWTISQLLQTIPGIGPLSAAALLACIGEISRFPRVGALVSLAGLALKLHESGTSVHERPHIDRHGQAPLRQLLYWCAISAMRHDAHFQAFAQRLRARGKPSKVIIVAVMRKLLHIVYGVWKSQSPYDPAKVLGTQS